MDVLQIKRRAASEKEGVLNARINMKHTSCTRNMHESNPSLRALRNGLFAFAKFCSGCSSQLANAAKFRHVCGSIKDEDLFCVAQLEVESSAKKPTPDHSPYLYGI